MILFEATIICGGVAESGKFCDKSQKILRVDWGYRDFNYSPSLPEKWIVVGDGYDKTLCPDCAKKEVNK